MDREGFLYWHSVRYTSLPYITDTVLVFSSCCLSFPLLISSSSVSLYSFPLSSSSPLLQNCVSYVLGNDDSYLILLLPSQHSMIVVFCVKINFLNPWYTCDWIAEYSEVELSGVFCMLHSCGTCITCTYLLLQVPHSKHLLMLTTDTPTSYFWVWKTLNLSLVWRTLNLLVWRTLNFHQVCRTLKLHMVWRTLNQQQVWITLNQPWVWRTINHMLCCLIVDWPCYTFLELLCLLYEDHQDTSYGSELLCNRLIGLVWHRFEHSTSSFVWSDLMPSFVVAYVIVSIKLLHLCMSLGSLKPP